MYKELLYSCIDVTTVTVDAVTNELMETGGSEDVEKGEGVEGVDAACSTVLEAGGSGCVEETAVGAVIVLSLNRTSAM